MSHLREILKNFREAINWYKWLLISFGLCVGILRAMGISFNPALYSTLGMFILILIFIIVYYLINIKKGGDVQ